jgi:hypothetical protein
MLTSPVSAPAPSLLTIVEGYRSRIALETGRTPDYPTALKALDRMRSDGDDVEAEAFPVRKDLLPLRLFLAERQYTDVAIEVILREATRHGSLWCSSTIEGEDLHAAEALLPGNAWQWGPEADADVYSPVDPSA